MSSAELEAAAAEAEAALAAGTGDAYDCMVAALGRSDRGDATGAEALFKRALALEPGNPAVLTGHAVFLKGQGRMRDAVLACDAAIHAAPGYADAWLERGAILSGGGSGAAARESFARAAELAPHSAAAHAGLAGLAAREGDAAVARHHATRALQLDPANLIAASALAQVELEAGQFQAVVDLLEPRLAVRHIPSFDRSLGYGFLADALHRLGRYDAAFAAYSRCKADFAAVHERWQAGRPSHRAFVEAIHDGLAALPVGALREGPDTQPLGAAPRHLFLLGYPRSGTTLLENVLASLPGVTALEERPTLMAIDQAYLTGDPVEIAQGLADFAALDMAGLDRLRDAYWDRVHASGVPADAGCFIDMDPLKGTRLPFIARLFPEARILLMRRDPRDVVWSCFKTQFALTSGTLDFTSLERAARHYDALMRLTELALERLPLAVHVVDYRALVGDFDATTRAICDFAGLEWSEAVRGFDKTARHRGVATASVGQVRKGLYDGSGQWRPYAHHLEPVLPFLAPWIEKFGYD